uniref:Uncharacterized protein n=1 Tax=Pipistrellus kuhlii TaxID=59472 RepID=A0A7J7RGR7_PIPKU|nr:hypothetical protein mPipKuh1_010548 [Pipistrellus kuhlii]
MPGRSSGNTANRPAGPAPRCCGLCHSRERPRAGPKEGGVVGTRSFSPFRCPLSVWSPRNGGDCECARTGRVSLAKPGLGAWQHQLFLACTTAGNGKNPLKEGHSQVSPAVFGRPWRGMPGMACDLPSPRHAAQNGT